MYTFLLTYHTPWMICLFGPAQIFELSLGKKYILTRSMQKMSTRRAVAFGAVIFSACLSSFGYYFYQLFFTANVLVEKTPQNVAIRKGITLHALARQLKETEQIEDVLSFVFVGRILGYDKHIVPGHYKLAGDMSNLQAIRWLRSGQEAPIQLRFHGLRRLEDLSARVSKQLQMDHHTLLHALCSKSVAQHHGFDSHTFPLMFVPNTYEVYWTISVEAFLARMQREYARFWDKKRRKQAKNIGLTPIEVGILSSIVQAETTKNSEKKRIAGAYLNRLRMGMPLGADPTLIFAWQDFSLKRVLHKHMQIGSPYNTYRRKGLPPGPINLPEIASIEAVLQAENHQYLYFCAKADFSGYHVFSKTLRQHQYHARRYQRNLSKQQAIKRRNSLTDTNR